MKCHIESFGGVVSIIFSRKKQLRRSPKSCKSYPYYSNIVTICLCSSFGRRREAEGSTRSAAIAKRYAISTIYCLSRCTFTNKAMVHESCLRRSCKRGLTGCDQSTNRRFYFCRQAANWWRWARLWSWSNCKGRHCWEPPAEVQLKGATAQPTKRLWQ